MEAEDLFSLYCTSFIGGCGVQGDLGGDGIMLILLLSLQARGSGGGRRRNDAASQDDHDKPYVCDSK